MHKEGFVVKRTTRMTFTLSLEVCTMRQQIIERVLFGMLFPYPFHLHRFHYAYLLMHSCVQTDEHIRNFLKAW